jgi:hypothetical protein
MTEAVEPVSEHPVFQLNQRESYNVWFLVLGNGNGWEGTDSWYNLINCNFQDLKIGNFRDLNNSMTSFGNK